MQANIESVNEFLRNNINVLTKARSEFQSKKSVMMNQKSDSLVIAGRMVTTSTTVSSTTTVTATTSIANISTTTFMSSTKTTPTTTSTFFGTANSTTTPEITSEAITTATTKTTATTSITTSTTTKTTTTTFTSGTTTLSTTTVKNLETNSTTSTPSTTITVEPTLAVKPESKDSKTIFMLDEDNEELSSILKILKGGKQKAQSKENTLISRRLNDYRSRFELISSLKSAVLNGKSRRDTREAIEHNLNKFENSIKRRKLLSVAEDDEDLETRIESREFDLADQSYETVDDKVEKLASRMRRLKTRTADLNTRITFGDLNSIRPSFRASNQEAMNNKLKDLSKFLRLQNGNNNYNNNRFQRPSNSFHGIRDRLTTPKKYGFMFSSSTSQTPVTEFKRLTTQNSLLQTYIISQTKINPHFESLTSKKIEQTSFTSKSPSGDENLIDCKDNDFGLECSCSITLSPPKCKKLINSFLSSCRILGCQNSGKCINMTGDIPSIYIA